METPLHDVRALVLHKSTHLEIDANVRTLEGAPLLGLWLISSRQCSPTVSSEPSGGTMDCPRRACFSF